MDAGAAGTWLIGQVYILLGHSVKPPPNSMSSLPKFPAGGTECAHSLMINYSASLRLEPYFYLIISRGIVTCSSWNVWATWYRSVAVE
jgi:hypothetical protein